MHHAVIRARRFRRIAIGAAMSLLATAAITAVATTPASASPGSFCGTYGNGYTDQTIWYKKPPGCHDFNITWAKWSGYYAGWYWNGSKWIEGSNGSSYRTGGKTWDQVAVSSVATGTPLITMREDMPGTHQGWNVHVNY
jgi:hypothetical protein